MLFSKKKKYIRQTFTYVPSFEYGFLVEKKRCCLYLI